ncbi:MAG: transcriptional repressor [Desulfatirhabdiaceae bacterium]|nr:transcriptional repressor [Desulfatirhabdiaceae bacterium]
MFNDPQLRMTRQRQVILQELRKVRTHPSADEVYEMVRRLLPRISLGTVYRNLEILSELGEIQKIEICGKLKRFDGNTRDHYHLRCLNCHRIDDVPEKIHFDFNSSLSSDTGYAITGHRLEFVGLCPECSEQQGSRLSQKIQSHMKFHSRPLYE